MMFGMGGGMIAMMLASVVFYLAVLVLAVLCIVWLVRNLRQPATGAGAESAEEVLRRRYASGEIDDEEYRRRLAGLQI